MKIGLEYLSPSWKEYLLPEFKKSYFKKLEVFLTQEIKSKKNIYPKPEEYFMAFSLLSFQQVKVVILAQDPYHGLNQAHGLCFSVRSGVSIPPSLLNIFKELKLDLDIPIPSHGCLTSWAQQGVLLLNSVLTVEAGKAGSHQKKGWEIFTDHVISVLNKKRTNLVFMLWGQFAQQKGAMINFKKHYILKTSHPSPFSVHKGFSTCCHFSKANNFLKDKNKQMINWEI